MPILPMIIDYHFGFTDMTGIARAADVPAAQCPFHYAYTSRFDAVLDDYYALPAISNAL